MRNQNQIWHNNATQFSRLLCELNATQSLDLAALCESMDLNINDINELFDRATETWESAKGTIACGGASVTTNHEKEIVVRVAANFEPVDGDAFDAVQSALEHFGIPSTLIERDSAVVDRVGPLQAPPQTANVGTEYFPGACVEEIGSVMMQDVVGDYDTPDTVPEWQWVEQQACFNHCKNGVDGIWDFVLNLSLNFDDVPETLRPILAEARKKNMAYVIFHQGT